MAHSSCTNWLIHSAFTKYLLCTKSRFNRTVSPILKLNVVGQTEPQPDNDSTVMDVLATVWERARGPLPPNFFSKREDSVGEYTDMPPARMRGWSWPKGQEPQALAWLVTQDMVGGLQGRQTGSAVVRLGGSNVGDQLSIHGSSWPPTFLSQAGWQSVPHCYIGFHLPLSPDCDHFTDGLKPGDGAGTCPLHKSGSGRTRSRLQASGQGPFSVSQASPGRKLQVLLRKSCTSSKEAAPSSSQASS